VRDKNGGRERRLDVRDERPVPTCAHARAPQGTLHFSPLILSFSLLLRFFKNANFVMTRDLRPSNKFVPVRRFSIENDTRTVQGSYRSLLI
jgi:hypothetical protein